MIIRILAILVISFVLVLALALTIFRNNLTAYYCDLKAEDAVKNSDEKFIYTAHENYYQDCLSKEGYKYSDEEKRDAQRSEDIEYIRTVASSYFKTYDEVPSSIKDLTNFTQSYSGFIDPKTSALYELIKIDDSDINICANFETQSRESLFKASKEWGGYGKQCTQQEQVVHKKDYWDWLLA